MNHIPNKQKLERERAFCRVGGKAYSKEGSAPSQFPFKMEKERL